jgi:hypothetical protein
MEYGGGELIYCLLERLFRVIDVDLNSWYNITNIICMKHINKIAIRQRYVRHLTILRSSVFFL